MIIDKKDVKIETFRATGNGGQNVNKLETAVRITHLPTNITATSQDERTQGRNKKKAFAVLFERLQEHENNERRNEERAFRSNEMLSGRVRTYNFAKNIVIDHRHNTRTTRIHEVLDGNLSLIRP